MTTQEQAQLLLRALRRVLVDLDTVAIGSLETLDPAALSGHTEPASETSFPVPHVDTISFFPDEDSTAPAVSVDIIRSSQRRTQVAALLSEIEAEILS